MGSNNCGFLADLGVLSRFYKGFRCHSLVGASMMGQVGFIRSWRCWGGGGRGGRGSPSGLGK